MVLVFWIVRGEQDRAEKLAGGVRPGEGSRERGLEWLVDDGSCMRPLLR